MILCERCEICRVLPTLFRKVQEFLDVIGTDGEADRCDVIAVKIDDAIFTLDLGDVFRNGKTGLHKNVSQVS